MDVERSRSRAGVAIVGVILAVVGLVWTGQGAGLIGGSFMTGQSLWLYIGIAMLCAGAALVAWARRAS